MTLMQQLCAIVTGLFIVLFFGSARVDDVIIDAELHSQLQRMVQSHDAARDGTMFLASDAAVLAEALIASGAYREVTVNDRLNKQLVHRVAPVSVPSSPAIPTAWFPPWHITLSTLSQALQIDGTHFGTVVVVTDPRHVMATIRQHDAMRLGWFIAVWVLTLILIRITILRNLRALQQVVAQANALSQRDYPIQHTLPVTPKLRSVVVALNRLSTTLRTMLTVIGRPDCQTDVFWSCICSSCWRLARNLVAVHW